MDISRISHDLELRHLRYFVAVAEEQSFTRAAKRLHIAQPPLSQQIRQLETRLGCVLLERRPMVRLTDAGAAFLEATRHILNELGAAAEITRRVARGDAGTITIGFASTAMFQTLPRLLQGYRARHPDMHVRLRELHSAEQEECLRSGSIDVAISREPPSSDEFVTTVIAQEPFVAVLPRSSALARRTRIAPAMLGTQSFVLFPRQVAPTLHDDIMRLCRSVGFEPRVVQEFSEWHTITAFVASGGGVSVAPASIQAMRWSDCAYRQLRPARARTRLLLCHQREPRSSAISTLIDLVRPMR